jgi:broad specificity phosphatase PhoE
MKATVAFGVRHAITPGKDDPVKFNPPTERPNDCSSGSRQLNDEGRAQSRLIGQRIKELNIPIGEVYSSSFCRCEETTKLAFDKVTSTDWLLVRPGVFKPDLDRALRSIPTKGFFNKVPSVLDVNYPDRSATTILAGGRGG